jgi:hypothetical protein
MFGWLSRKDFQKRIPLEWLQYFCKFGTDLHHTRHALSKTLCCAAKLDIRPGAVIQFISELTIFELLSLSLESMVVE